MVMTQTSQMTYKQDTVSTQEINGSTLALLEEVGEKVTKKVSKRSKMRAA